MAKTIQELFSKGTQAVPPSGTTPGASTTDPNKGVVDVGTGEAAKHNTTDATDPTQAAIRLVQQRRQEAEKQQVQQRPQQPAVPYQVPDNTGATDTNKPSETKPADGKALTYAEMYQRINPYQMPSKEQVEAANRKERRERLFSAISDGISALSNLYYTSRYAPNAYNPAASQYAQTADRWDRLRRDRDANMQRYLDGYIKAQQADDAAEYKQADTERKNAIAKAQQEVLAAKAAKDDAATALAKKKLEYLILGWPAQQAEQQAKIDLLGAQKQKTEAETKDIPKKAEDRHTTAEASMTRANKAGSSSSSGGKGSGGTGGRIPWYDKDGNLHYAKTEAEAKQQSKQNGTYVDDYATNTSTKFGITSTNKSHSGWHSQKPKAHTVVPQRTATKTSARTPAKTPSKTTVKKKTGVVWK